jgi:hypothetical protein
VNLGSTLKLGKESDSNSSRDDKDDDMYGSSVISDYSLFPGFQPPVLPDDACTINLSPLQPANEQALLALCIKNHLPQQVMYNKIMDWAHFAHFSNYKSPEAPVFCTTLLHMHTKYANICGGRLISEIVIMSGYQPMHVYCFYFLQQAKHLFSDHDLLKDSLLPYDPKVSATGKQKYSKMNTGDFWKLGVDYVMERASLPTADKALQHFFCPVILFIDATIVDRIG